MIYELFMLVSFLLVGYMASGIGAIPASSSNIAVVTTTLATTFSKGFRITLGAGIGSVILSFLALQYSRAFTDFFEENPWIQYTILFVFFSIGVLILLRNKLHIDFENPLSKDVKIGNFWKGLLLALVNPPALVFWILIISVCNTYLFSLSKFSPILNLALFFTGILLGKITTLYYYGKMSKKIKQRKKNKHPLVMHIVGAALVIGSIVQFVRMLFD
ncbi:LysE family transporter [Marinirhabdus gelatinilytica]|uniref:LysE type translocator n=1 Tax=Marinirhabdus gelatinilytica TaxID=1703343 RepID=A0A370Q4K7_9FLAO|nr:LysE family transporter [Marinirhabdus gelatinilytica]RDK82990.1 LysE type translocator [Marinirhabdus gelatinilytica]